MIYTLTLNPSLDYIVYLDTITIGSLNIMEDSLILAGGKGINVSMVLHHLGFDTIATGFLAGFTGSEIVRQLDEQGCKHDFVVLEKGNNRINVKLKGKQETEINGIGPSVTGEELQALIHKFDTVKQDDFVVLSGSVPNNLPQDIYEVIMKQVQKTGAKVVLDTRKEYFEYGLKLEPFLVKPNIHELGELFDVVIHSTEEVELYARKVQKLGAQNVLVSLGKDGALLLDEYGNVQIQKAPQGKLVNSVGSGDSMVAGFIAGYCSQNKDYLEALKMGVAAGSASAFSRYLATKEEIEEIRNRL